MKRNIQLIALDMDGTLFNSKSQISKKDQDAIKAAADAGIHITISTGRPLVGLPVDLLSSLGIRFAITSNGAGIYRLPEKECIFSGCMEPPLVCSILRALAPYDLHYDAFINGNGYGQKSLQPVIDRLDMPDSIKSYIKTSRTLTDNLADFIEENALPVQKMTLNFYPTKDGVFQDRDAVLSLLSSNPEILLLSGGYHNLEFTKAGISKGTGLAFLSDLLKLPVSDTLACGDTENDIDILTAAGIGVAMGNAMENVKKAADFITLSNEESGVAHAIRKFCLN